MNEGNDSLLISDYILCKYSDMEFTPFQLIKLVFLSHGNTLGIHETPLIHDRIEAWRYGPVIPVLYHKLKKWKDNLINVLCYCGTNLDNRKLCDQRLEFFNSIIQQNKRQIINSVVKEYGNLSFEQLNRLCHAEGSPWDQVYNGEMYQKISDDIIKRYYKKEENQCLIQN